MYSGKILIDANGIRVKGIDERHNMIVLLEIQRRGARFFLGVNNKKAIFTWLRN